MMMMLMMVMMMMMMIAIMLFHYLPPNLSPDVRREKKKEDLKPILGNFISFFFKFLVNSVYTTSGIQWCFQEHSVYARICSVYAPYIHVYA